MNNFTKDELMEVYYALDLAHTIPLGSEKPPLMQKISDLITNYCDYCNNPHCNCKNLL